MDGDTDRLPELETPRLRLYPQCIEDLEARLAMDRDPEVMRFIREIPEDAEAQRETLRSLILGAGRNQRFWHIEEKENPGFLGWCGLFPLDNSQEIEIGYRLSRASWGHGIASEAAGVVLDYGFRVLEIDPILAVVHPQNIASQYVLAKLGLKRNGEGFHYGQQLPVYRMTRADYLESRSKKA